MKQPKTDQAMADFLARGGQVTQCPSALADDVISMREFERRQESASYCSERAAEQSRERYHAGRGAGWSQSEALDYANEF